MKKIPVYVYLIENIIVAITFYFCLGIHDKFISLFIVSFVSYMIGSINGVIRFGDLEK